MLATVLSGTAAAQTDPCQSQKNQVNQLKAMLRTGGTPGAMFFNDLLQPQIDLANRDVVDCSERVAETEHDRLRGERSRAGKAYANAAPYSQERRDARAKWNEANEDVEDHESANPSVERNQPYNDGLSDFERHWCLIQDNPPTAGSIEDHGGSTSQNVTSVTCF